MHVWYVDAGIEDTPEPVYTHCLVLSCLVLSWHSYVTKLRHCRAMYTDLRRQPRQCKGVLRTCPNSERSRSETAERTASSQKQPVPLRLK